MTVAANAVANAPAPVSGSPAIDPVAVAQAMDPAAVAAHMVPATPPPPGVMVADRFFGSLDGAVVAAFGVIMIVLVVRLIQSWLLHRSINKSIEAKSDHTSLLIDKVNKPFEAAGPREIPGDDRNGLVLLAVGVAMAGFGVIQGEEEIIRLACGAALFPALVGAALLIRRRLVKREMDKELAADRG